MACSHVLQCITRCVVHFGGIALQRLEKKIFLESWCTPVRMDPSNAIQRLEHFLRAYCTSDPRIRAAKLEFELRFGSVHFAHGAHPGRNACTFTGHVDPAWFFAAYQGLEQNVTRDALQLHGDDTLHTVRISRHANANQHVTSTLEQDFWTTHGASSHARDDTKSAMYDSEHMVSSDVMRLDQNAKASRIRLMDDTNTVAMHATSISSDNHHWTIEEDLMYDIGQRAPPLSLAAPSTVVGTISHGDPWSQCSEPCCVHWRQWAYEHRNDAITYDTNRNDWTIPSPAALSPTPPRTFTNIHLPMGTTTARSSARHSRFEFKTSVIDASWCYVDEIDHLHTTDLEAMTEEYHTLADVPDTRLSLAYEMPTTREQLELFPIKQVTSNPISAAANTPQFIDLSRPSTVRVKMRTSFYEHVRTHIRSPHSNTNPSMVVEDEHNRNAQTHASAVTSVATPSLASPTSLLAKLTELDQSLHCQWMPLWRIDFTMTWSGTDAAAAHTARLSGRVMPFYEVEIECCNLDYLWTHIAQGDATRVMDAVHDVRQRVIHAAQHYRVSSDNEQDMHTRPADPSHPLHRNAACFEFVHMADHTVSRMQSTS